jgi:hypothetical protein
MPVHRLSDVILIAAFALATAGVGTLSFLREPDRESLAKENRTAAPLPEIKDEHDLKKFPERFDRYFNDRLPEREALLSAHATVEVRGLGVSSSDKVLLGRDGWLFLNEQSENPDYHPQTLPQYLAWARSAMIRAEWLANKKIDYLFVLVPEKHTIYEEFLPPAYGPPQPLTPARRLAAWQWGSLGALNDPRFLRIDGALLAAKQSRQVYFRTDTHWNDNGAYVAYVEIVRRLALKHNVGQPLPRERFDEERVAAFPGDLGRMLHLPDPPTEEATFLKLRKPRARKIEVKVPLDPRLHSPAYLSPQVWGTGDKSLPRGVIFHDSFVERLLLPLLAEHFEYLVYAPTHSLDPTVIERFNPDVVIQQLNERRVNRYPPLLPEDVARVE